MPDRLGPPAAYAAELRATAGVAAPRGQRGEFLATWAARVRAATRSLDLRAGRLLGYEHASDFGRLLRPGWWVLRGYLAAVVILAVFAPGPFGLLPTFNVIWLAIVGLAIVGSVRLGKIPYRLPSRPAVLAVVGNVAVLLVALVVGIEHRANTEYLPQPTGSYQDPYDGVKIFPYDRDGKPLRDVQLVDQNGDSIYLGDNYVCGEPYEEHTPAPAYPACGRSHPYPSLSPLPRPTATPSPSPAG